MDKSNLLKALDENGLFAEYDDLYSEDVTVRDWVSRNEDLVRSNRAIAQAIQADAPHDVKAGYFKDKEEKRQYDAGEKKYNEESAKKQQLADEYQRAKEIEDLSSFSLPRTTNDMSLKDRAKATAKYIDDQLIALGFNLTPQAAKNVYIKEGYNPSKIGLQAGIGTVANVAELLPGPGKLGKAIETFAAPVIRAGQDIYEGKDLSEVGGNFAFDTGLNSLLTYMPVKEVYNYVKRVLGQGGEAGEKVIARKLDDILEQADLLENKDDALALLEKERNKVHDYAKQVEYGNMSDLEKLKFADEIANNYPELANSIRDEVQEKAANTMHTAAAQKYAGDLDAGIVPESLRETVKKTSDAAEHASKETAEKLKAASETVDDKLLQADAVNASRREAINNKLFDEQGVLTKPAADVIEAAKYASPSTAAKMIATVAPAVRGAARTVVTPTRKSAAPEDKEYDSALEYIIQSNKRQWSAGFKPHGGIELEAWQIAKDRGEI